MDKLSSLRLLRLHAGKTIYELSKEVGICPSRLSYLERGIDTPRPEELKRLKAALIKEDQK